MTTPTFDKSRYDELLSRGLPSGIGTTEKACIMACLNLACGGSLVDTAASPCVLPSAARFAIRLNDASWSSENARADGLYDLGLALLVTDGLDCKVFTSRLARETIRQVVPVFMRRAGLEDAAKSCETDPSLETVLSARKDADAAYVDASASASASAYVGASAAAAASAAASAASAACVDAAYVGAYAAASAAAAVGAASAAGADYRQKYGDETLILSAKIATEILTDMKRGS